MNSDCNLHETERGNESDGMEVQPPEILSLRNGVKGWRENGVKYGVYTILVLWVGDGLTDDKILFLVLANIKGRQAGRQAQLKLA